MTPFPDKPFFDAVYEGSAPWDVGAPQPDLIGLVSELPPQGRILDLGCGTGDLAIGLAQLGHRVLGVDFAEAALEVARERVSRVRPDVRSRIELDVGDALRPSRWAGSVGAVVDSGFFHLFDGDTRASLAQELARTLPSGGRYYMLGFAIEIPSDEAPRQVTGEELTRLFTRDVGWVLKVLRSARFLTVGFDEIPAVVICAERT